MLISSRSWSSVASQNIGTAPAFSAIRTAVKRFQNAKRRSAKQPNLLPRNHCRRALPQPLNICQSLFARAELPVLPLQNRRHSLPPLRRIIDFLDLIRPPILAQRRSGIKLLYAVKVMEIIVKQAGSVGNT